MRRVAALIVVGVVMCACAAYIGHYSRLFSRIDAQGAVVSSFQGRAMPEFNVVDAGGRIRAISVVLANTGGRLRAVALVRPRCPRCEALTARLQALQRQCPGQFGIVFVDVSEAAAAGTVRGPLPGGLRDADHAFERVFRGVVTPVLLLVAVDGRVVSTWSGQVAPHALDTACAAPSSDLP